MMGEPEYGRWVMLPPPPNPYQKTFLAKAGEATVVILFFVAMGFAAFIFGGGRAFFLPPPEPIAKADDSSWFSGDGVLLRLPTVLHVTVGRSKELRGETKGKMIVFMPFDKEIDLAKLDSKAVWVNASKAGTWRVMGYTAVSGLPTVPQFTTIEASKAEDDDSDQKPADKK